MMFYLDIDITKTPPADSLLLDNIFPYVGDGSILMKVSMKLPEQSSGGEVPGRELDAFTSVGSVLFNLDAALVR